MGFFDPKYAGEKAPTKKIITPSSRLGGNDIDDLIVSADSADRSKEFVLAALEKSATTATEADIRMAISEARRSKRPALLANKIVALVVDVNDTVETAGTVKKSLKEAVAAYSDRIAGRTAVAAETVPARGENRSPMATEPLPEPDRHAPQLQGMDAVGGPDVRISHT